MDGNIPALVAVLTLLAQGIGVGGVLAFLFERVRWFQNLQGDAKWWTILVISVGLPLAARLLVQFVPADVWAAIEPYWQTLAAGFLVWLGSQLMHLLEKRLGGGNRANLLGR